MGTGTLLFAVVRRKVMLKTHQENNKVSGSVQREPERTIFENEGSGGAQDGADRHFKTKEGGEFGRLSSVGRFLR